MGEFYSKSPDLISVEELRQYFIHLKCDKKVARQTSTQALCAIKLFWEKTLRRPWPAQVQLVRANHQFKLPVVLSAAEVRRILSRVAALDHRVCLSTMRITLDLFFAVTSKALHDLAANPRRLGAQLGMLGVLHTWARSLIFHPHIHYLIPGGGLSPDGRTWVAARKNFLLHHKALGAQVRTLFKQRLLEEHPALFAQVPAQVWTNPWNVGAQAAGSGENALRYLSRYVFKTATSNRKVQLLPGGKLLWTYRESKTRQFTSIKLEPLQFLSRFLQHVLPSHFARVRSFGWFQPAAKVRLNRVRALLRQQPLLTEAQNNTWNPPTPASAAEAAPAPMVPTACTPLCPRCRQPMPLTASWKPGQPVPWPKRPKRPP